MDLLVYNVFYKFLAAMTSAKKGFLASLEFLLGFHVHWIVYLQHFIEIILKHLLVLWDDGKPSKNPDVLISGPIGKKVENLHGKSKIEIDGKEVEVENLQPFVDIGENYAFEK